MIPKIIHQIWLQGEDKIPPELSEHYASCKRINNDFEHIFWDETKIKNYSKIHTTTNTPNYMTRTNTLHRKLIWLVTLFYTHTAAYTWTWIPYAKKIYPYF